MSESTREVAVQGDQKLPISAKVYPVQDGKNLLANATVTIGGCFAIRGVRVMNSEKGIFVSMPQRKSAEGQYKDICFPTTGEMRKALNNTVLGEYHRTMERGYTAMENRKSPTENRKSVVDTIRQIASEVKPSVPGVARTADKGAR